MFNEHYSIHRIECDQSILYYNSLFRMDVAKDTVYYLQMRPYDVATDGILYVYRIVWWDNMKISENKFH